MFIRGGPRFHIRTGNLRGSLGIGLNLGVGNLHLVGICSLLKFAPRLIRGAHFNIFNRVIASDMISTLSLANMSCLTVRDLPNRFSRHTTDTISYIGLISPATSITVGYTHLLLFPRGISRTAVRHVHGCAVGTIRYHRGSVTHLNITRRSRIGRMDALSNFHGVAPSRCRNCYERGNLTVGTSSLTYIIRCFHGRNHSPCRARLVVLSAC